MQNRRALFPPATFYRHAWLLVWGRVLRWRLETFGLYMPSLPHSRPWWRVNGRVLLQLIRHGRAYAGWVADMDAIRKRGPSGWWEARLQGRHADLKAYVDSQNSSSMVDDTPTAGQ